MPYAVVQSDLAAPTEEQLIQAFGATSGLRAADARRTARYQFGVIAEGLVEDDARKLQQALMGLGVPAQAIDQVDLPMLPPPRSIQRIDCLAESLELYDVMGRAQMVAWDDVLLVALGDVGYVKEVPTPAVEAPRASLTRYGVNYTLGGIRPSEIGRQEVAATQWVLEVHTTVDSGRYQAKVSGLLFNYLGPRLTTKREANFRLVLEDLLRLAPHALINRGVNQWTQGARQVLAYNSRVAFEKELRWLRWWGQQAV
jgi:hypothetical protein